jgi:bifunctional oligoribonuclease and PAP phosphatase NrnA
VIRDLARAVAVIREAEQVALACHVSPDGDALGSLMAMHHLCRAAGKPSVASWSEPFVVAPHYAFLPGLEHATKPKDFPTAPDVMITFDCGSIRRLGDLAEAARNASELIVIDHHATNDRYGTINLVDPDAAASAVVVRRVAHALGWTLTYESAVCLYTGVVTDTGRFQYSNTTPEVFALAQELAEFDLPIAEITRKLFEEHRFGYLQLVAECLGRAELDSERRFVATWVTADDLERFDVTIEETEGLIDLVRRTMEAEVSCVLKEAPDGVRVSLRSLREVDVAAIASSFGGGGHRFAAGFTSSESVTDTLAAIRAALPAAS